MAAQFPHPFAVEAGQVLVSQPRVPLTSERLEPRQFGGDGDIRELGLQAQVEGGTGGLSHPLAVEGAGKPRGRPPPGRAAPLLRRGPSQPGP